MVTSGYFGRKSSQVVQESNYGTNRVWTNNPTFLLSGQLTGGLLVVLQKVASEDDPMVRNHGEGPY